MKSHRKEPRHCVSRSAMQLHSFVEHILLGHDMGDIRIGIGTSPTVIAASVEVGWKGHAVGALSYDSLSLFVC